MSKKSKTIGQPVVDLGQKYDDLDLYEPEAELANALPAYKQTQDRLISMETRLLDRLKALADKIETDDDTLVRPSPSVRHMSLAAFNKALPSRLTALQDDIVTQIERIEKMLF